MVGLCENNNEPVVFIKGAEFLDQLSYNQFKSIPSATDICIAFVSSMWDQWQFLWKVSMFTTGKQAAQVIILRQQSRVRHSAHLSSHIFSQTRHMTSNCRVLLWGQPQTSAPFLHIRLCVSIYCFQFHSVC